MKNSGANSGEASRRGSVLMEFVVVAPLYFILLGGLFILGDLAMNRIRVHMGDHFVTWVGGSRFCPVKPSSKDDKDVDKVQALLKPLYDLSIGGAVDEVGFKVDTPSDQRSSRWNHTDLNHFMRLYMGRVKRLPLKMPDWARGMFGMQDAVTGTANMDEYETITYTSDECFRAYSFHRLLLTGIDTEDDGRSDTYSRARSISAAELVNDGYVSRVMDDYWISDPDENGSDAGSISVTSQSTGDVPRFLGYFGE